MKKLEASWPMNNSLTGESWTVHFYVRREDGYYTLMFSDDNSEWSYRLGHENRAEFMAALGETAKWPTQAMRKLIERGEGHKIASAARDTLPRELVWIDTDWDS